MYCIFGIFQYFSVLSGKLYWLLLFFSQCLFIVFTDCIGLINPFEGRLSFVFKESIGEEVLRMSNDEIVSRTRLLDSEIKVS